MTGSTISNTSGFGGTMGDSLEYVLSAFLAILKKMRVRTGFLVVFDDLQVTYDKNNIGQT